MASESPRPIEGCGSLRSSTSGRRSCSLRCRPKIGDFRDQTGATLPSTSRDRRSRSVTRELRSLEPPRFAWQDAARFAPLPEAKPQTCWTSGPASLGPRTLAGAAARSLRGSQPRQRAPERSTGGFAIGGTSTRAGVSGIEDPAIFGRAPLFRNSGRGRLGGGFRGGFPPHLLAVSDCHTQ